MLTQNTLTLTDVMKHDDFIFALCTFVDEFKRNIERLHMIIDPPQHDGIQGEQLCILAATAHKLANEHDITVPEWVHHSFYKMPYPIFAFNTTNKDYQAFLLQNTPYEFASKNIYAGANAIERR